MRVLALDQASKTGWALGTVDGGISSCGSVIVRGEEVGDFLLDFEKWFGLFLSLNEVDLVVFETPILPAQTQIKTLRKLYGLAGLIEMEALRRRVEVRECFQQQWRAKFIGATRAPKELTKHSDRQKWIKERSLERCRALRYPVANHDEADAAGIWHFVAGHDDLTPQLIKSKRPLAVPVDDVTL